MLKIDFERLSQFRYAIISMIGRDGYPWSAATEFEISPQNEILLKRPSSPTQLGGERVGVLFNHIAAIPTGGYTERRYMLIWGGLKVEGDKLKLSPEKISEWDEKILPFPELCARAAPQGAKFLRNLKPQIEA